MNMKVIALKCANCGAKLEVDDDMSRFACAYCGVEQYVERRGGTVSLRLVDAIQKVQAGTDKIAAELALRRLDEELTITEFNLSQESLSAAWVVGLSGATVFFMGIFILIYSLIVLLPDSSTGVDMGVVFILGGAALLWVAMKKWKGTKRRIANLEVRCEEIRAAIAKNKEIIGFP